MKQYNRLFISFLSLLIACIFVLTACDRLNLYDIASGKTRTTYAMVYNGTNYKLVIASPYFDKTFNSSFIFPAITGISVNKKDIIAYDGSNIYKADNNLISWLPFATSPSLITPQVFGYNDTFVGLQSPTYLTVLNISTFTWDPITILGASTAVGIFNGFEGAIYAYDDMSAMFYVFTGSDTQPTTSFYANPAPSGSFIGGFRTKNYFYIWFGGGNSSIFRTNGVTDTNFNLTTPWDTVYDVAVTDDDKIFAIISESGINTLIRISGPNYYTPLISLGNDGTFMMDCLDNERLVIASNGNTSGYNGLFIYNISKNAIEKFITTENVLALYVPR